jgi:signal transduction histidine kinase
LQDRALFESQIEQTAVQQGDLILSSLRHGMLNNDRAMLHSTLVDILSNKTITRAWIINLQREVKISSNLAEEGRLEPAQLAGCEKCHRFPASVRPRVIWDDSAGVMRISSPIQNGPECLSCHSSAQKHLGVLLIDVSMAAVERNLQAELQTNLLLSTVLSLLLGVGAYFAINTLIVSRVENLHKILIGYSSGDFRARVPETQSSLDEITSLGKTFNQMADKLEEHETQVEERARVREIAIIEERERIARELHDGIAQFLGYVITKTEAARLLIEKGNSHKADEFMHQIEDETRKQSIDVRASILGLKVFTGKRQGLASDLRKGLVQSNRFMDLEVTAEVDGRLEDLRLAPETDLQLLRIVQEAVSNIRKHSQARRATVSLKYLEETVIQLSIHDDGIGFDPSVIGEKGQPHFGLVTMRERAEAIGGVFEIQSAPLSGTTISVTLKLPEKKE